MIVHVVIPYRGGCEQRDRNLRFVTNWWGTVFPSWPIHIGIWPSERGPWRKSCAIRSTFLDPDDDDIVIVTDADVIPAGILLDVCAIAKNRVGGPVARWAMPFQNVYRLNPTGTILVLGGKYQIPNDATRAPRAMVEEVYRGTAGGGCVALLGEVYKRIPMDPRFAGYGQEDMSWSLALHRLAGAPRMGTGPLWHLWHPPQDRARNGPTVSRGVGSRESLFLWQRYREAATPTAMRSLLDEAENQFEVLMGVPDAGQN